MAHPVRKPLSGTPNDEALEILRRLEPVLGSIQVEQQRQGETLRVQGDTLRVQGETLRKQGEDIVKLQQDVIRIDGRITGLDGRITGVDGRLAGIEGQLRQIPTIWTLASLIFAIFGASFVLIRFASGH